MRSNGSSRCGNDKRFDRPGRYARCAFPAARHGESTGSPADAEPGRPSRHRCSRLSGYRSDLVLRSRLLRGRVGRLVPNAVLDGGRRYDDVTAGHYAIVITVEPTSAQRAQIRERGGGLAIARPEANCAAGCAGGTPPWSAPMAPYSAPAQICRLSASHCRDSGLRIHRLPFPRSRHRRSGNRRRDLGSDCHARPMQKRATRRDFRFRRRNSVLFSSCSRSWARSRARRTSRGVPAARR